MLRAILRRVRCGRRYVEAYLDRKVGVVFDNDGRLHHDELRTFARAHAADDCDFRRAVQVNRLLGISVLIEDNARLLLSGRELQSISLVIQSNHIEQDARKSISDKESGGRGGEERNDIRIITNAM